MTQTAAGKNDLWDFSLRFVTPTVRRSLPEPGSAVALELGCGEGRRLQAAARLFGRVIGVDSPEMIDVALSRPGRAANVELVAREGLRLPVESGSVDFVFSFHGLTQFDSLDRFNAEVLEAARVLRPGGVAQLWFGRITRLPFALNPVTWIRGYSHAEGDALPLKVQQTAARRALRRAGFKHLALSTPLHPDTSWRLFRGGNISFMTAVKKR
ncbi:MAG: class I SAM-dependent methyltransferase [Chloroflexi bacterium]|nr:class I SAM-dependent methyltransferase [Chloroflexota bacterium]